MYGGDDDSYYNIGSVSVSVDNGNHAPTVEITSLEDGANVSGIVNIGGTASDNDGISELQGTTTSDGVTYEHGVWLSFDYNGGVMSSTWFFASSVEDDGSWSYEWDSSDFYGKTTISAVAWDGDWDVDFNVDSVEVE